MKTLLKYLPLVALVTSLLCGCSTTPKQSAYKSLAAVGAAASNAGDALAAARYAGKVNDADWQKAVAVQRNFLLAYNEACRVAAYDFTSYSPTSLLALEAQLIATINQILTP